MRSPESHGWTGRARDRWWPVAIFATVTLILASIFALAVLLSPRSTGPAPRSASGINVQPSDLGAGWAIASEGSESGPIGLAEYNYRAYSRQSGYGGTVIVGSSVEIYNTPGNASREFAGNVVNASKEATGAAVELGDHAFGFQTNKSAWLLFIHNDTVVWMSVHWYGLWEDLSGRAFSAEYRLAGDLLILGRIVNSRI